MKKLQKMRKNQKGFTLVELIVVLVILAILAAMLVPALLGYIDRAKAGKYNEEIHSIYTALQVINDERYAKGRDPLGKTALDETNYKELTELKNMIAPTDVEEVGDVITNTVSTTNRDDYTVYTFGVLFKSQDGNYVYATFADDGTITVDDTKISTTKPSVTVAAPSRTSSGSSTGGSGGTGGGEGGGNG